MQFIQAKICSLSDWLNGKESFTAFYSVASLVKKSPALSRTQYRGRPNSLLSDSNGIHFNEAHSFASHPRTVFFWLFGKIAKSDY